MRELGEVRVHQDGETTVLAPGMNTRLFREGELFYEVECPAGTQVLFDDQPLSLVGRAGGHTAGYGRMDLTNQVGFHRFTLVTGHEANTFDIQTRTAKATLSEVESMARVVAGQVFSFKRQFVYMAPAGKRQAIPLPEVAVGWLRDRLDEIVRLVRAIDDRPATEVRQQFVASHQARGVSVPRTLRLLRETPALLEAIPGGPLEVVGQNYWPAAVVVRQREREPARIEHMQLAHFLARLAQLVSDLGAVVPQDVSALLSKWGGDVRMARATRIVRRYDVPNARAAWTVLPTQLQRTERRYRRMRELHAEFLQNIDVADYSTDAVRANVRDVWEIYQAFVAHMIGRAFALSYVSARGDLRERGVDGASMSSAEYDLFYDVRPPRTLLRSWRDGTVRPADERPDIVLRRRGDGAVAVLDAKFKVDRDGQARSEDLFEMQGYLNSFGLRAGAIVFPGARPDGRSIAADGRTLLELPIRARLFEDDEPTALANVRRWIEEVLTVPDTQEREGHRAA
ncbi:MAG: hypothetical protein L6Q76_06805 [Polyangiaceae bacterium]|nr:hypothetical protein [Polyangiaceae bacterium]